MSIHAIKAVGIGKGPDVATLPGSRIHDEIVPARRTRRPAHPAVGVSRPTNNAGGLEGGVTNGEELRVTGYMKPIATLMQPLRSVDLDDARAESPAAIERSDVCAVTAAAVVGEAMVASSWPTRSSRSSAATTSADIARAVDASTAAVRARFAPREARDPGTCAVLTPPTPADDPADRQARRRASLHRPAAPVGELTPEIQQLIDDMIETMYAAPGVGLAAPQVGVPLRLFVVDVSVGRRPEDLLRLHQPGVRRARRHAARGGRLPERAGLQRHRRCARRAPCCQGLDRDGAPAGRRRHRACSRARSSTRWITSTATLFVDRLRGIKRRHDRPQDPQAAAAQANGDARAAARRVLRHAGVRRADARRPSSRRGTSSSGVVTQPDRPRGRGQQLEPSRR